MWDIFFRFRFKSEYESVSENESETGEPIVKCVTGLVQGGGELLSIKRGMNTDEPEEGGSSSQHALQLINIHNHDFLQC